MLRKDLLINFNALSKRTATKRAGGGKTNNKDSAGRSLGPKKIQNQFTHAHEVLMRQVGSATLPGENAVMGRDYTINSIEPGYVKFYRDPFHHNKKFVGVALSKESILPKEHFSPTERRFGKVKLDSSDVREMRIINKYLQNQSRFFANAKEQQKALEAQQRMKDRIGMYKAKKLEFIESLETSKALESIWGEDFVKSMSEEDKKFVAEFVYLMSNKFKYSYNIEAAFEYTKNEVLYDNKTQKSKDLSKANINTQYQSAIPKYYDYLPIYNEALGKKIQETIDFNKLDLGVIQKISKKEKEEKKDQLIKEVSDIKPFLYTKDNANFKKIMSILDKKNSSVKQLFDINELNQLKNKLFPEVLPLSWEGVLINNKKDKNAVGKKLYDPETKSFENVLVSKFAFKKNAKEI